MIFLITAGVYDGIMLYRQSFMQVKSRVSGRQSTPHIDWYWQFSRVILLRGLESSNHAFARGTLPDFGQHRKLDGVGTYLHRSALVFACIMGL